MAAQTQRIAMLRTYLLSQAFLRLALTPQGGLEERIDAGVFYVGLGDQFDDDRRRVRAATRPTSVGVSSPADTLTPLG
jgi:hypothetical protein